jgi:hypothetical protein
MIAVARLLLLSGTVVGLVGCDRIFAVSGEQRMGYLRELVRARNVSRDSLPIDGCSVDRFMAGVPSWRDSLVAAERAMIVDALPCTGQTVPVQGRFVITRWHRNWSGEFVIRGSAYPWDQGYRFTDGVYVGRETSLDQQSYAGVGAARAAAADTGLSSLQRGDSIRRGGVTADSAMAPAPGKPTN